MSQFRPITFSVGTVKSLLKTFGTSQGNRTNLGSDGKLASGNQMTKRILQKFVVGWALVGVALGTIACPDKGPAEKAGEKVDDAVDKAKDAVK